MKRVLGDDDDENLDYNSGHLTIEGKIQEFVDKKDAQILQLQREYLETLKDIEAFYGDQSHQLCMWLWNNTKGKIEALKKETEQYINHKARFETIGRDQKRVCL